MCYEVHRDSSSESMDTHQFTRPETDNTGDGGKYERFICLICFVVATHQQTFKVGGDSRAITETVSVLSDRVNSGRGKK